MEANTTPLDPATLDLRPDPRSGVASSDGAPDNVALMRELARLLADGKLPDGAAPLVARLAAVLPYLSLLPDPAPHCASAEVAMRAATGSSPALEVAKALIAGLEWETAKHRNPVLSIVRARTAALPIFFGMFVSVLLMPLVWGWCALLLWRLRVWAGGSVPSELDPTTMLYVAFAGGIGAEVSIMLRLSRDWLEPRTPNYQALFLEGYFRPWIGVAFALFSFALLRSGAVFPDVQWNTYAYLAIAFATGFSERLGDGLIETAAGLVRNATEATSKPAAKPGRAPDEA